MMGQLPGSSHTRSGFLRRWGVAALVCLAGLAASGCASSLLLYPTSEPLPSAATRKTIAFEGGELELWTIRTSGSHGCEPEVFVLSLIGNADRAERNVSAMARSWGELPAEIWALNYPGYGGSSGAPSLDRVAASALAAFDAMQQVAGGRRIFVSGVSMGATAALHVAADRPVAGLVLRSPPPLRRLILGKYGWWNLWLVAGVVALQVPSELDSLANGANVHAPAVFVLTRDDSVVPLAYQQDVVDSYGGEKTLMLLARDHNDSLSSEEQASLEAALRGLEERSRPAVR